MQKTLFGIDNSKLWEKEWQNMPEFISEEKKYYAEINYSISQ